MVRMTADKTRSLAAVDWLPAERLGQCTVDARLRPWLIAKGLLTQRMRAACGEHFALRLVEQRTGLLDAALKAALPTSDAAGLFRDVEMCHGEQVWVFAQSVVPDSTLSAHPWLAELGDSALGETLHGLSGVHRSSYEYASLPAEDAVTVRALRNVCVKPLKLWARRSRISLRGAPMLIQEIFLPAMGTA
jgi:chorismate--pyruvate lyase